MRKKFEILLILFVLLCPITKTFGHVSIVPLPQKVVEHSGNFIFKSGQCIGFSDATLKDAAVYLKHIMIPTGYRFTLKKGSGDINLVLLSKADKQNESYTLSVTNKKIYIKAKSYRGIVNGISSLRQLLPEQIEANKVVKSMKWTVPAVEITDKPAYAWRGLMLDVSRHFYTKKEVERFLDIMALYKFNKFHWHLTDDQGWRVQIKKYPLLTEKGAWRKMINIDQICMNREKTENNPDFVIPKENFKVVDGDSLYGGYYTQQDIRDVVKYAAIRGIDIIPELDMPGHCFAAVANYQYITCFKTPSWGALFSAPICPGRDAAIDFCKNVYKEIFSMFPYGYVHLGADEVDKTNWQKCPECQARIKAEGLKSEVELHSWFVHQMEKFFNANGKRLIGWDEILEGGLSSTATVDWWRGEIGDVVKKTTDHGNEVILCPTTYCYFDYPQDNNTIERIYRAPIVPEGLSDKQLPLIKGMQANLWTEMIPSNARLQFMAFPRALALAERAWTSTNLQSWEDFAIRLQSQLKRMDVMKVKYRKLETDIK